MSFSSLQNDLPPDGEFALPPVLRMYWAWLFGLSVISAIMGDIYYRLDRFVECCTLPTGNPFFTDFWVYQYIFQFLHTRAFFDGAERFAYPAFSAVVYDLLYHLGPHAQAIFCTTELGVCGAAAWLFYGKIRRIGLRRFPAAALVLCTLLFSYPLQFLVEDGNIEILVCFLTAGGLWAFLKGREGLAASLWGLAGAMKLYPILLLAVFLTRAKWRYMAIGTAVCVLASVLSMWFIGPTIGIAFQGTIHGVAGFVSSYAERARIEELKFDHSLLAPFKLFTYLRMHRRSVNSDMTKPYLLIAGSAALLTFFLRVRHMPVVNRLMFLFVAIVALPPVSYQYTLVHLYAPWAMLVIMVLRCAANGRELPELQTAFVCFAFLFTSQNYIFYHLVHINGLSQTIALVVLTITMLRHPIPDEVLAGCGPGVETEMVIAEASR